MPKTLRELRKDKGSQLDAYKETGIPPGLLSNYERGKCIPTYKSALKLSEYLGISPGEIQRLALEARNEAQTAAANGAKAR